MLKDTRPSREWWEYRVAPLWDCVGRVGDVLGKTRGRGTSWRRGRQAGRELISNKANKYRLPL